MTWRRWSVLLVALVVAGGAVWLLSGPPRRTPTPLAWEFAEVSRGKTPQQLLRLHGATGSGGVPRGAVEYSEVRSWRLGEPDEDPYLVQARITRSWRAADGSGRVESEWAVPDAGRSEVDAGVVSTSPLPVPPPVDTADFVTALAVFRDRVLSPEESGRLLVRLADGTPGLRFEGQATDRWTGALVHGFSVDTVDAGVPTRHTLLVRADGGGVCGTETTLVGRTRAVDVAPPAVLAYERFLVKEFR